MLTLEELTNWTSALRANPEQQILGILTADGCNGFCCLGKLCQSLGRVAEKGLYGYLYEGNRLYLPDSVSIKLGSQNGHFLTLDMPKLKGHESAAAANDAEISWLEIADHFDKYYPYEGKN